jgi:heat shock protein HslJ
MRTRDKERRMRLGYELGLGVMLMVAHGACVPSQPGAAGGVGGPLAGSAWRLTELAARPPVAGATVPTLEFAAAGEPRASGNGGCNQFNGSYTQDGASLRFGALASTRRACADEAATTQETVYMQVLRSTTRFTRSDRELVLYIDDEAVARFEPAGG